MEIVKFISRAFFTLSLLYGVYTETGFWTTMAMFLVFAALEASSYLYNNRLKELDMVIDVLLRFKEDKKWYVDRKKGVDSQQTTGEVV
ncbi:MAG TPA: hypothetical protein VMW42_12915 [Desulfatiglandales bacterium]|nr:hypothetical protein [Desulfatiglandales bacterium]